MKKQSSSFTGYSAIASQMVPSATIALYCSGVILAFIPQRRLASASEFIMYHISVLPFLSPYFCAFSSSGCTCIDKSCLASMNLMSNGNSSPNRL